jgi:tetratricopeptide (TPR) repeat protein
MAQHEGEGNFPQWQGLYYAALAHSGMGHWDRAEKTAEELRSKAESLPTDKEKRRYYHLMGKLALDQGESRMAVERLERAQSMLPAVESADLFEHVPIWFSLARAYLQEGDEEKACEWFQRVTESTTEHIWWPVAFVRSFYFLGKIHERRGDLERAREYYRRYREYWQDGDMDRERLQEVDDKLRTR